MSEAQIRLQAHGRAILEAAKDHLAAALASAPADGWTAAEWASAAGLLLDGAPFGAVFAHHLGTVLVAEGRAIQVGGGPLPRFCGTRAAVEQPQGAVSAATNAPHPLAPTTADPLPAVRGGPRSG